NISGAVSENSSESENPETLSSPVQNEYIPVELPNVTEPEETLDITRNLSPADNLSESTPAEPVNSSAVKNGYLLFTNIPEDVQVVLTTITRSEIVLDKVETSTLSVPVPADYQYYSSWRLVGENQTLGEGQIVRYPAPDETVVIPVTAGELSVTEDIPAVTDNVTRTAGVPFSLNQPDETQTNNSGIDLMISGNETPVLSVPPVQPLPSSFGTIQDGNGTTGPLVLINGKSGEYEEGYTITAYAGPGGAIFPEGTVNVQKGGNVTFVLTPYDGRTLDYLLVDGSTTKSEEEYAFVNVTGDHTIIAGFS
ncbi:MAG: hypothetical protein LUQ07_08880, partial [Methanospirillum sp.]|nr:hypothetical protein [Methanospirillum sp.]